MDPGNFFVDSAHAIILSQIFCEKTKFRPNRKNIVISTSSWTTISNGISSATREHHWILNIGILWDTTCYCHGMVDASSLKFHRQWTDYIPCAKFRKGGEGGGGSNFTKKGDFLSMTGFSSVRALCNIFKIILSLCVYY